MTGPGAGEGAAPQWPGEGGAVNVWVWARAGGKRALLAAYFASLPADQQARVVHFTRAETGTRRRGEDRARGTDAALLGQGLD